LANIPRRDAADLVRRGERRNAAHPLRYLTPPMEKSRRLESPALTFAVSV
jgi:hypothetical protein